jgi:hypothetical protein
MEQFNASFTEEDIRTLCAPSQAVLSSLYACIKNLASDYKDDMLYGSGFSRGESEELTWYEAAVHPFPEHDPLNYLECASLKITDLRESQPHTSNYQLWFKNDYNAANGTFFELRGEDIITEEDACKLEKTLAPPK